MTPIEILSRLKANGVRAIYCIIHHGQRPSPSRRGLHNITISHRFAPILIILAQVTYRWTQTRIRQLEKSEAEFPARKRFGGTSDGYVARRQPWACAPTPEGPFRQGLGTTPVDHRGGACDRRGALPNSHRQSCVRVCIVICKIYIIL